jgi:muramoyltetrapeptide carboxypeptidase
MHTIIPPYLSPGDTIGITCPAGYVSPERIAYAVEVLQRWGFTVRTGKTVGTGEFYFSGSDAHRLQDLQDMLDDRSVKAILMGRGGYGTSRIIDDVDFTAFRQHPKWICGFSDITVLHSHILATLGVATLHGPMTGAFTPETEETEYIQSVRKALTGEPLRYAFPSGPANRPGTAEGLLTGGNLAMLAHLTGSVSQVDTRGKILLIEDIGEHFYQVDRLLLNLKRSGQLEGLAGLLVGTFSDMEDTERPFGQTLEEIVMDKVQDYNFPVAFNLPCGHTEQNVTLRLGLRHRLEAGRDGSVLEEVY